MAKKILKEIDEVLNTPVPEEKPEAVKAPEVKEEVKKEPKKAKDGGLRL